MKREIQMTADGSHTLFVPEMEEHYHSVNGAVQESRHVFLKAGMDYIPRASYRILEIGFGTGLNALLTRCKAEEEGLSVEFHTIEKFPVEEEMVQALNYGNLLVPEHPEWFTSLHEAAWERTVSLSPLFSLHKIKGDFNEVDLPQNMDVVFFDAFAPDKQPEVWNQELFDRLYTAVVPGGVLVTYCAKGAVRRMLQQAGFTVQRIPGPPGKREMLRACKPETGV